LRKPTHNAREVAEIVAIQALAFVAGDADRLGAFQAESGIGPETLRGAASDPRFLAHVLDFVMRDDATVKALPPSQTFIPPILPPLTRHSTIPNGSAKCREKPVR
jgi:hypothetical protein